jgi:hypothetical protein
MKSQSQSQGVQGACLMGGERMRMDRVLRIEREFERQETDKRKFETEMNY